MPADCSVLHTFAILKTFVIRLFFFKKGFLLMFWAGQEVKNPLAGKLASADPDIIIHYNINLAKNKNDR